MSLLLPAVLLVHSMSRQEGTKALYHAYNQLQTLSQQFTFPISTPAVVVVGQQTDGKSALIEALMGFQFNHVGGGTKTRRPIALQMQYRPECEEPRCFIVEGGTERQLRLPELRAYIEAENSRLEAVGAFEASELIIRIDFKYCPNLNIIDTPGMLTMAPSSPTSFSLPMQSTDSKSAGLSDAVRDLILNQIAPVERIILCVEETRCWESSQVRSLVVTVDPDFSRTVVVSTKLDTKFTQLSTASELRNFLAAADLHATHPKMLGGPFFTSVPIGRVGGSSLHGFSSDGEYQVALSHLEQSDMHYLWEALGVTGGTRLSGGASASNLCAAVGVSRLRSFLEQLLRERYLAGLNSINVQLKTACGHIAEGVREAESLLEDLSPDRLQGLYSRYVARFMERFEATWSGSMAPEILHVAQTIAQEHAEAGRMGDHDIQRLEGADCALFGGAQFIRLIREFEACVRTLPADPVSEEELCNTLGLDAQHDALHIGRTACGLALDHSFVQVRPLLEQLEIRLVHILGRMFQHAAAYAEGAMRLRSEPAREPHTDYAMRQLYGDDGLAFLRRPLEDAFSELLINSVKRCMQACYCDMRSSGSSLAVMPKVCTVWPIFVATSPRFSNHPTGTGRAEIAWSPTGWFATSIAVDALVRHFVGAWRQHFATLVKRKVHFCVVNLIEGMPAHLLHRLHAMGSVHSSDTFDVTNARSLLLQYKLSLIGEHAKVNKLLDQFQNLRSQLEGPIKGDRHNRDIPESWAAPCSG